MKLRQVRWLFLALSLLPVWPLVGQTSGFSAETKIDITQRSDLRRSVNGVSKGLVYGFSRATWFLGPVQANGSVRVQAHYYLTDESNQDGSHREKALSGEKTVNFTLAADGTLSGIPSASPPWQRGFPAPPPPGTKVGQSWVVNGDLVVDPDNSGVFTTLPIVVQYTLAGNATWLGQTVLDVRAKYAIRYQKGRDPKGNPNLTRADGTRDATIYLDPITLFPVFVRERVTGEVWQMANGTKIQNDGFILTFYEGGTQLWGPAIAQASPGPQGPSGTLGPPTKTSPPSGSQPTPPGIAVAATPPPGSSSGATPPAALLGPTPPAVALVPTPKPPTVAEVRIETTKQLKDIIRDKDLPRVDVKPDPRGVALTLEDLRFVADSVALLPGEGGRLDKVASLLKTVSATKTFLVVGHTAKIGTDESQIRLSFDRAMAIVDALKQRGIDPGRILFDGRGGSQPIAENETEEGRAKNRRVEIIILD